MTLQGIKPGDIVKCNYQGDVFHAVVHEKGPSRGPAGLRRGELMVGMIERGGRRRIIAARRIEDHWRKSKASRSLHQGTKAVPA